MTLNNFTDGLDHKIKLTLKMASTWQLNLFFDVSKMNEYGITINRGGSCH
jgi:hypothetical protein